ncbi:chromosome segregation protein SMC [Candidatus Endobugula sertula]|uniref:Chromosome partition protein Smc n=1 Tax=Candidatus Endobugula sertula TaxID=62101 RepID=A0A1D2QP38_9GAMM|nr:chromosome segregation protein SMC [Candidatus Endobugula sertula]
MRLKSIKLAGFKSFVDPTTVSFPSNLCAVVGPNGCGKSNIIDAVRWVMGESSAKNLRGESMADVIFNGSGGRKPVGQASIELIFDNSDGSLVGEYAEFNEIAIKRKVTRDGQNIYYLNGIKCRRRDITDIFLGTGLGPRSYAIIEQGMISGLIEAKPEELRVYIEEAAGISKYKERRRDTENRMRRTMENLERLTDIREELERQLVRLQRQAKSAQQYAEFKKEERELSAQLSALRYRLLDDKLRLQREGIRKFEVKIEACVTEQVGHDTSIEKRRAEYVELGDKFNEVQGRFYGIGTEIARLEQSIQHIQERNRQLQEDLQQTEQEVQETTEHLVGDQQKAALWGAELAEIEPELEVLQASEDDSGEALLVAEEAMQSWQLEWDEFNQRAAEPRQKAEVEQSRIQHLEQVQTRLLERIRRLEDENNRLPANDDNIAQLTEQVAEAGQAVEEQALQADSIRHQIDEVRESIHGYELTLDQLRNQLQTARGRHASLETLQQAAKGGDNKLLQWIDEQSLAQNPRLLEKITVNPKWQGAVETVLGDAVQAICVDGIDFVTSVLSSLEQGSLVLLDSQIVAHGSCSDKAPLLVEQVVGDISIKALLNGVYTAEKLSDALALRSQLNAGESVITSEGIWLGENWLRVKRDTGAQAGVLARQEELQVLSLSLEQTEAEVEQASDQLRQQRELLKRLEQQREQYRRGSDDSKQQFSELRSALSAQEVRLEQSEMRRQKLLSDIDEAKEQLSLEDENLSQARTVLEDAITIMEQDSEQREQLLGRRDTIREVLDQTRQRARHDKDKLHAMAMQHQSVKTQLTSIKDSIKRLNEQLLRLQGRSDELKRMIGTSEDPTEGLQLELEALLERRITIERELAESRRTVENVEQQLRDVEQSRSKVDRELQALRTQLTDSRVAAQTVQVQCETIVKTLMDDGNDIEQLLESLPENIQECSLEEKLTAISNRITRLGPINLAAIEEHKNESERKQYLDTQNDDLNEALETLKNAIKKIDRETRTRFKETFDSINSGIQELFPKVFGGGHAYLELTGDDMLDTGIAIMARPPGKRNSTIHLLSGGEKALTAIALVFSIFRLNPAPFCMLDEVDAPLDDANVGRYARLVEEMSSQVQFIYITHNKIAMEMAHQLMGVTMHEAGVSRMVTVDVNEAAELAAV